MEYYGIPYLQARLTLKRFKTLQRYRYYEMKNHALDFGISSPPELRMWSSVIGWCAKGVDSLADRLDLSGFKDDVFDLEGIYDVNNRDVLIDAAILGALICSCSTS